MQHLRADVDGFDVRQVSAGGQEREGTCPVPVPRSSSTGDGRAPQRVGEQAHCRVRQAWAVVGVGQRRAIEHGLLLR
jgi:hypothetical protein